MLSIQHYVLGCCVLSLLACQQRNELHSQAQKITRTQQSAATEVAASQDQILVPPEEEALVRLLLERNFELRSAAAQRDRSRSQIGAINRLPATMVKVTPIGEMAETAAGTMQASVMVEQAFLPIGVVGEKKDAVLAEYDAESARYRARQIQMVRIFRECLFQRKLAGDVLKIVDQQLTLLDQLHEVVEARVANAAAMRGHLLEVEMQQSSLHQMRDQWIAIKQDTDAQIKYQLSLGQHVRLPDAMKPNEWQLDDGIIQQMAQAWHPLIQEAQARMRAAEAQSQAERNASGPNFSLGVNYTWIDDDGLSPMANGDDQWALTIGLRIPLDRSVEMARHQAADELTHMKYWQLKDVKKSIEQELQMALNNMHAAQKQWLVSKQELMVKAQERFDLVQTAYEAGRANYLDLIEAWKQLLQISIQERKLYTVYQQQQCRVIASFGLIDPNALSGVGHE